MEENRAEKNFSVPYRVDPFDVRELIKQLDKYQESLYPAESNHLESIDQLKAPHIKMYGCSCDGEMVAMGAVKLKKGYGEIKRVYVTASQRGNGLAKRIMAKLELEIRNQGLLLSRLETGIYQEEAIGFYMALGYYKRKPFGKYKPDPLSVFMEKKI
jgi:putative acetyltransferase